MPEYELETATKSNVATSMARCCTSCACRFGYWEAKDDDDDLDAEIEQEIQQGLPAGQHHLRGLTQAVLIQNRQRGDALRR